MTHNTRRYLYVAGAVVSLLMFTTKAIADNPIITHKYTADPNAIVVDDRVYIYCSHDLDDQDGYDMYDYVLISSDDLVNWTDHGEVFDARRDTKWANNAYAPTVVAHEGQYYLYFPNGGNSIGVAVADAPEGPFVDPIEGPLVTRSTPNANVEWCFDPAVFIDDDGQAYLYFGGGQNDNDNARVILLGEDMISVKGEAITIDAPRYFEAPFMHKYEGRYYYSYSTDFSKVPKATIDYMISDNPVSGFEHQGTILANPLDNMGNNNHASLFTLNDKWYVAYHSRSVSGTVYQRSVNIDQIFYAQDGTIEAVAPTQDGVEQIKNGDAFTVMEAETLDNQNGIETETLDDGARVVGSIDDGDWVRYTGFDFGTGASEVKVHAASKDGASIELHLDSEDGTLAGTCDIPSTGGLDKYETVSCEVTGLKGIKTFYTVFSGDGSELLNIDWFQFVDPSAGDDKDAGPKDENAGDDDDSDGCSCNAVGHRNRQSVTTLLRLLFS